MFGLPEVLAETEKGNRQQAAQIEVAVPSIVMYLVQRGEAIPDGNTCSIPNGGSYRIASEEGMMRLNPIEAPPGT